MIYNLLSINSQSFKYGIMIPMMLDFHRVRSWLTNTYGLSDQLSAVNQTNEHWAFAVKYNHNMIYIKGDEELSWFKIKHGESL